MRKGFTLIELLVVIGILGVLATTSMALLNPSGQLQKSRDSKRKADLQQIRAALELYRSDNDSYPVSDWVNSQQGDSWIAGLTPNFLKTVPKDPKNSGSPVPFSSGYTYSYYSSSFCGVAPGTSYILTTRLENTTDSEINNIIRYGSCDWGGAYPGLYTVSSP
ncbi:MAG TPA: prepilin-type N-terminal cleavage/methylation domain-containing protein [Candidatus Limnocylindrales bacterium]|nr:prepilin-type N-terminal cleavage/methylation domain-containing protein [Candidatus Limnocylindrales bacterium]